MSQHYREQMTTAIEKETLCFLGGGSVGAQICSWWICWMNKDVCACRRSECAWVCVPNTVMEHEDVKKESTVNSWWIKHNPLLLCSPPMTPISTFLTVCNLIFSISLSPPPALHCADSSEGIMWNSSFHCTPLFPFLSVSHLALTCSTNYSSLLPSEEKSFIIPDNTCTVSVYVCLWVCMWAQVCLLYTQSHI